MKKYLAIGLAVLLVGAFAAAALAGAPDANHPQKPAGKGRVAHLYLYEKDAGFVIVDGGAWGKATYNVEGETCDFVFNGKGLDSMTDYTLVYYPEPQTAWPWLVIIIAQGTTTKSGNIHLSGTWDPDQDFTLDVYYPDVGYGAKIWLVLTDDINASNELAGWDPEEYLFEHHTIGFDDTTP